MGTSMSSSGPGSNSPLVPSWADGSPDQPQPNPEPQRYRNFRRSMGDFVANGDRESLRSALKHYSKATGGGRIASRRMGSAIQAGGALYGALRGISDTDRPSIDLGELAGQSCDVAIERIVEALVPLNGDSDKIRVAMNNALVEALDNTQTFDPDSIDDELLINTMLAYMTECIFNQMASEMAAAWDKAESPTQAINAEESLREVIRVVVDDCMESRLVDGIGNFSIQEMDQLQQEAVRAVWAEWENYR